MQFAIGQHHLQRDLLGQQRLQVEPVLGGEGAELERPRLVERLGQAPGFHQHLRDRAFAFDAIEPRAVDEGAGEGRDETEVQGHQRGLCTVARGGFESIIGPPSPVHDTIQIPRSSGQGLAVAFSATRQPPAASTSSSVRTRSMWPPSAR